jgi:hypothetical protein
MAHRNLRDAVADLERTRRLVRIDAADQEMLRRVSELPTLPEGWRGYFRKRLWDPDV